MKIFLIGGIVLAPADPQFVPQQVLLQQTMRNLGRDVVSKGHCLAVCSPLQDSADFQAVKGAAEVKSNGFPIAVEFYLPNIPLVQVALAKIREEMSPINVRTIVCPAPADDSHEALRNAWLLAQLTAMEACYAVMAIGGKLSGSMSLLLRLAETRLKIILPFPYLGGAAAELFDRRRYLLSDQLGDQFDVLSNPDKIAEAVALVETLSQGESTSVKPAITQKLFISYAKANPENADFVEMLLRRRGLSVYRDERDFEPGSIVQSEIDKHIQESDVFIALWCQDYACSPWCFDELERALDLQEKNRLKLWIICTDDTRMIPQRARKKLSYSAVSRDLLEKCLIKLIDEHLTK
jgi:hypothetical protein